MPDYCGIADMGPPRSTHPIPAYAIGETGAVKHLLITANKGQTGPQTARVRALTRFHGLRFQPRRGFTVQR